MKKFLILLIATMLLANMLRASELEPAKGSGSNCSNTYSMLAGSFKIPTLQKYAFLVPTTFAGASAVACAVALSVSTVVPVVAFAAGAIGIEIKAAVYETRYEHFMAVSSAIDYSVSDGLFGSKESLDTIVNSIKKITKKCSFMAKDNSDAELPVLVMSAIKAQDAQKGALCDNKVEVEVYTDSKDKTKTTSTTTYDLILSYKDFIRVIAKKVAEGKNDNECVENIKNSGAMKKLEIDSNCDCDCDE